MPTNVARRDIYMSGKVFVSPCRREVLPQIADAPVADEGFGRGQRRPGGGWRKKEDAVCGVVGVDDPARGVRLGGADPGLPSATGIKRCGVFDGVEGADLVA